MAFRLQVSAPIPTSLQFSWFSAWPSCACLRGVGQGRYIFDREYDGHVLTIAKGRRCNAAGQSFGHRYKDGAIKATSLEPIGRQSHSNKDSRLFGPGSLDSTPVWQS